MKRKTILSKESRSTPAYFFVVAVVLIFLAEALIMRLLEGTLEGSLYLKMFLDSTLLSIIVIPTLYLLLFRPMLLYIKERKMAQEQLREVNEALEDTVKVRTVELQDEIRERTKAAEALSESEERYRAVIQTAIGAIITSDNKGKIISWNSGAKNIFDYREEEILGEQLTILMPERYRDKHTGGMERLRLTGETRVIGKTVCLHGLTKDGREFPLELSLARWETRGEDFYTGIINDITERVCLEDKLKKYATTDELTQAYNRAKFDEIIASEIERFERYQQLLSIVMLDIDNFKEVNDTYGHIVGDSVLKTLVDVIKRNKRGIDSLVRWGGEEFMIVAPGTDLKGVKRLGERLKTAIESHEFDTVGKITVSLGATEFKKGDAEDSFIKRVDEALYKAKMTGKNRLVIGT